LYSTCLFCNQSLGSNEIVESFPVGRRLAFDQRQGRLWVVCRKCEKWNLTPLEERWEAIETCERLFRDTRKRVSTDNIGLARLSEGLELVRIGEPQRPEFAAWRYGQHLDRRRRRQLILANTAGVLSLAATAANIWAGAIGALAMSAWQVVRMSSGIYRSRRVIARVPDPAGGQFLVRGSDAIHTKVVEDTGPDGWALQLTLGKGRRGKPRLTGGDARRAAARIVPHVNRYGGNTKQTLAAVNRIESVGSPEKFLAWVGQNQRQMWRASFADVWLGVEMAVNEENERHALETELAFLEDAWKEAEEIARIADNLFLPRNIEHGLHSLQQSRSRRSIAEPETPA
jgi:hypothetical protein